MFDTYWRFAAARQALYGARLQGRAAPWTRDPILRRYRFTNCYRAADRVSQFLISQVIYQGPQDPGDVVFRTLLFKVFNRIPTWQRLEAVLGEVSWQEYDHARYERVLTAAFQSGERLYSAAYVVPPPRFGESRKHANHLRLLELMMSTGVAEKVRSAGSLRGAFEVLRSYPAIGDFLAYQYVIDLNYSPALEYDEMEFVVPGPGARDGIRKCFGRSADGIEADVIRYMADHQEEHFTRLRLPFGGLRGRRLQLIDCQNLFCEVDKYARVAHPDVQGISGRTRIKQSFRPVAEPVPAWFPPKWGINAGLTKPSPRHWPTTAHLYDTDAPEDLFRDH
ncbi:MAG: nucleotide kinase domain-containing protein [Trebonia sp.]|uniref:nucleotide kinase domain-containing protein n=1 Tax=Trebonia sp. TaxID=2767075 RepID=UPI003C71E880